jgi:AraC family transcriptional regulator
MKLSGNGQPRLGAKFALFRWASICETVTSHCMLQGPGDDPDFAVVRIRSGPTPTQQTPSYPLSDAILICVSLTPTAADQWQARYKGRAVGVTRAPVAFATTVLDLRCSMEMSIRGPFDLMLYYLSTSLLRRVAAENEIATARVVEEIFFMEDLVLAQLTRSLVAATGRPEPLQHTALEQVALVLGAHVLQRYCGVARAARTPARGLLGWQKLRVEEMLRARPDADITTRELASACSISERHFRRSFRGTFGASVHQYRVQLRIELAKSLLATTDKTLAQIAHLCGFYDQAAFTRAFGRVDRMTPARWRRFNGSS